MKKLYVIALLFIGFLSCSTSDESTNKLIADSNYKLVWNEEFQLYEYVLIDQGKSRNRGNDVYFNDGNGNCSVSYYNAQLDQNMAPVGIDCCSVPGYTGQWITIQYADRAPDIIWLACPPN